MRAWTGPLGFLGAAVSLVFWIVVPLTSGSNNLYIHSSNEGLYIAFIALSAGGIVGALMAGTSRRLAPALMGLAVIPGVGALLLPGLLLVVATLVALDQPAGRVRPVQ